MPPTRHTALCAAFLLLTLPTASIASEEATLPAATLKACDGLQAGDVCTIVGPTGIETGGVCRHHPKSDQLFCQPEGMPDDIILEKSKAEDPPDPGQ